MLSRFYEDAKTLMRENWAFVEKLAERLVEKDTIIFEDIVALKKEAA